MDDYLIESEVQATENELLCNQKQFDLGKYLLECGSQATEKDLSSNQTKLELGKWLKRVKCLLECESLTKAVHYWSEISRDKPKIDSGISSSECSLTSVQSHATFVNSFDGYGENIRTSEMGRNLEKSPTTTASSSKSPILEHPYWKKLCSRIRKFEKTLLESKKNALHQSHSNSHLTLVSRPKSNCTLSVQQVFVEPKLKSIFIDPNTKSVCLKQRASSAVRERHLCYKDSSEPHVEGTHTDSTTPGTVKPHSYEVESVRLFTTQSTQTSRSRNSSNSSKREKRLKFRARIRVLPQNHSNLKCNMDSRSNPSKDNLSFRSASTSRSRKIRTSISCSKLNRCPLYHATLMHSSSARGRPTYLKWSSKRKKCYDSVEVSEKASKRSITSQNSRSTVKARKKRRSVSKSSKPESKVNSKVKSGHANLTLKPNKSTEVLQKRKKSLKFRPRHNKPSQSELRQNILIERKKSRKSLKEKYDEPSYSKHRDRSNLSRIDGEVNERKKTSSKTLKSSGIHIRKHLISLSEIYTKSSPNAPPPTPVDKTDSESTWDVKMKVDNMLHHHRQFVEWQCNKISETCQNLLSKGKPMFKSEKDMELGILQEGDKEDEQFMDSKNKIKDLVQRFLGNTEKKYVDEETSIDLENCEQKNDQGTDITNKNENKTGETFCVYHEIQGAELKQQDSSTQTFSHAHKCSVAEKRESLLIDLVNSHSTEQIVRELEKTSSVAVNKTLDISASEVWTSETPKLSDDDVHELEIIKSISDRVTEDLSSNNALTSNSKTPSEVSVSRSITSDTRCDSPEEKSAESYSDHMSCSSGEIPVEKLRSAEVFLDHFLGRFPKMYSQLAATERNKASKNAEIRSKTPPLSRRSSMSPTRRRASLSPSNRPPRRPSQSPACSQRRPSPSPAVAPRRPSPSPSRPPKRLKSPACPKLHSFSTCRASGPSEQFKLINSFCSDKQPPRSQQSQSRDRKTQFRSKRNCSADSSELRPLMNLMRMKSPPRARQGRSKTRATDHNTCNIHSANCEHRRNGRITRRNWDESLMRCMTPDRGRDESRQRKRRNHSAVCGEQRRRPRDKTPASRFHEHSRDRHIPHYSRRQHHESSYGNEVHPNQRMVSLVSSSGPGNPKYFPSQCAPQAYRDGCLAFRRREETRTYESSSAAATDHEPPPCRPPSPAFGKLPIPAGLKHCSGYEVTKRWEPTVEYLKGLMQSVHASELLHDAYKRRRSMSRSRPPYLKIPEPSTKPWDVWQGHYEPRNDTMKLNRGERLTRECRSLNRDYITESTSAEGISPFAKPRRQSLYR